MQYESRFLFMSFAIAGVVLGGCTASTKGDDRKANQDITVTCTSGGVSIGGGGIF